MSKELVISSDAHETRVAILEEDQLAEIYFQRANEYSLAGSIHKGRVTRVLPGMQSAFVDLGLERDTFLYVSDFFEENGDDFDRLEEKPRERGRDRDRDRSRGGDRDRERERETAAPAVTAAISEDAEDVAALAAEPEVTQIDVTSGGSPTVDENAGGDRANSDRRGRRSRRRRSRGRGFPESKYASDLSTGTGEVEAEEADAEPESLASVIEAPREVFLLPGESLAKYRMSASAPEPDETEDGPEPSFGIPDEDPEVPVTEPEPEPEPYVDPQPEEEPAPVETHSVIDEAPAPAIEQDAVELAPEELEDLAPTLDDEVIEAEAEAVEIVADDEEDDIDEVEDPEPFTFSIDEVAEPDRVTAAVEDAIEIVASPSTDDTGESASASVRESGGRYPHRMSRRMRRKRERGDAENRNAGAAPPVVTGPPPERDRERERDRDRDRDRDSEPRAKDRPPLPSISDLLREGQEIIVQIAKEPLGQKGARITSHIALPGRFVVFMPTLEHFGVSRKIASDEERQRLKRILQAQRTEIIGGFIVRTAGEGRTEEEIAADMQYLYNLWLDIRSKAEKKRAPALLHHDLDIVQRILRDQLNDMFKAVWIDNEDVYESVLRFMQRFQPALVNRVKLYTRPEPIFDTFGVTADIEKALRPKVWLKSGGYIVINQTEALVAIDINTGKFVGKSNRLEDTITKTNMEAVKEIVRQVRLRDLGGIIVIDFIDMDERKNRQKVMQALEEAMRADRAPNKILQFNDFGLVAITRKRVKQSLERALCSPCPICEGAGYTKSVSTVVGEVLQEALKIRKSVEGKNVVLRVYPEVAKFLKSHTNSYLEELESILGRPVVVKSDGQIHPEKFDLAW